MIIKVYLREDI